MNKQKKTTRKCSWMGLNAVTCSATHDGDDLARERLKLRGLLDEDNEEPITNVLWAIACVALNEVHACMFGLRGSALFLGGTHDMGQK